MITRKGVYIIGGIAVASVIAAVYFIFDPAGSAWFPRCPFLVMTGYRCPGCGSQRALHALLHGEMGEAWRYNALLMLELPLMVMLTVAWLLRRRFPRLRRLLNSQALILTLLTIIILWTIARNIADI